MGETLQKKMKMTSRKECLAFLEKINMPRHIRGHSMLVAEVGLFIGSLLNRDGHSLDLGLIETGALLHDLGKERSLATGEDHAKLGADMLAGIASPAIATIVREHIFLEESQIHGPLSESLLVNYSDKRVMHEKIVSLDIRFHDLIARYAGNHSQRDRMLQRLDLYLALESRIFSPLDIDPVGAEILRLQANYRTGDAYGTREVESGVTGWGQIR